LGGFAASPPLEETPLERAFLLSIVQKDSFVPHSHSTSSIIMPPTPTTPSTRKRAAASKVSVSSSTAAAAKRKRLHSATAATAAGTAAATAIKADPDGITTAATALPAVASASTSNNNDSKKHFSSALVAAEQAADLKRRFIAIFAEPEFATSAVGVSNDVLKARFGSDYTRLPPIINQLTAESRLVMSQGTTTTATTAKAGTTGGGVAGSSSISTGAGRPLLFYNLVSDEVASKFAGLDASARMVYQVIERAGNMGIWTKDIKKETNIQNQAMNKILKALESRRLIKQVKSVTAKNKKLYMMYSLTPSTELTGGVWYSDLEFDHEFISELRTFLMHCVRRLNGGHGCTLPEILEKLQEAKVSRVPLSLDNVRQLMQTLMYDYLVVEKDNNNNGPSSSSAADVVEIAVSDGQVVTNHNHTVHVPARRITPMCEFKWWADALSPDFQYREIQFEDGVHLAAHEPHYHTD
jgi:DNA-directed RNA polymerase III subunit RPC6